MSEVNMLLEQAPNKAPNLKAGEVFRVKDLIRGYEWNQILRGDRMQFSTLFLNCIKSCPDDIGIFEKVSSD